MQVNCIICDKEFKIKPSEFGRRKCCSLKCMGKHRSIYFSGINHPMYGTHRISPMQGKHHSKKTKKKISIMFKGQHHSPNTEFKKGQVALNKGKQMTVKQKKLISNLCKKRYKDSTKHPMWNGGRCIDKGGYVLIHKPKHPFANVRGYIFEHRLIMEQFLGRYLMLKEVVHHINHIRSDNRIENLMLFPNDSEHKKYQHFITKKLLKYLPLLQSQIQNYEVPAS